MVKALIVSVRIFYCAFNIDLPLEQWSRENEGNFTFEFVRIKMTIASCGIFFRDEFSSKATSACLFVRTTKANNFRIGCQSIA